MSKIKVKRRKKPEVNYEVVPTRRNRVLNIILRENKSTIWKWTNYKTERFRVDKNTYFRDPSGVYLAKNKTLCSVYIEGVSLPVSHGAIERSTETREYVNPMTGKTETMEVPIINNLKFDSEIIDFLLNRHLADEFTRVSLDKPMTALIVLVVISLVVGLVNIGVTVA
jgi:hypothetical protein